nr:hypothetical protein CFP56_42139 [Quercus suber]
MHDGSFHHLRFHNTEDITIREQYHGAFIRISNHFQSASGPPTSLGAKDLADISPLYRPSRRLAFTMCSLSIDGSSAIPNSHRNVGLVYRGAFTKRCTREKTQGENGGSRQGQQWASRQGCAADESSRHPVCTIHHGRGLCHDACRCRERAQEVSGDDLVCSMSIIFTPKKISSPVFREEPF